MQSLQLVLRSAWDFVDKSVVVEWSLSNQEDLLWWSGTANLLLGVSLEEVRPDLLFWSDASNQGWDAHLQDHFILALWSPAERSLLINLRELHAICLGLFHFRHFVRGLVVGIFVDNTTSLLYVGKQGGTFSLALNAEAQLLLRWAEEWDITLVPQFTMGPLNVVADSLNCQHQVQMDACPGRHQLSPDSVAGHSGPVHHFDELPSAGILLPT